ncbi:BTB/POZ protein [Fusarium avenaceum]|nr:BTB/POZ protein [Fusarium avenaceum]
MAHNQAAGSEIPQAPLDGIRTPSSAGSRYREDGHSDIDDFCGTSIHAALSTLLGSDKFSDMTIICGGREFKAHRAVVCTQSSFFDKAMCSNFKEATSRVVELPEDDPDVVERFLEFLYTGTYSDGVNSTWGKPSTAAMLDPKTVQQNLQVPPGVYQSTPESEQDESTDDVDPDYEYPEEDEKEPEEEYTEFDENSHDENTRNDEKERAKAMEDISLLTKTEAMQKLADLRNDMTLPLRLYVMADKYDVPALRLLARDRFYRSIELVWENAECFPDIVDELYQTTPPTDTAMREIVCRLVGTLILDPSVREKMRPVMAKHGDFAVGVMEYAIHLRKLW